MPGSYGDGCVFQRVRMEVIFDHKKINDRKLFLNFIDELIFDLIYDIIDEVIANANNSGVGFSAAEINDDKFNLVYADDRDDMIIGTMYLDLCVGDLNPTFNFNASGLNPDDSKHYFSDAEFYRKIENLNEAEQPVRNYIQQSIEMNAEEGPAITSTQNLILKVNLKPIPIEYELDVDNDLLTERVNELAEEERENARAAAREIY